MIRTSFPMRRALACFLMSASLAIDVAAEPAGSAFTIQGRLAEAGVPTNTPVDLRFTLYDAESGGTVIGSAIEVSSVVPEEGVFSLPLDFGALAFLGDAAWVEVEVRDAGAASYSLLSPRQRITPTPYALQAQRVAVDSIDQYALQAGAVTSGSISPGAVGATQINSNEVQRRIGAACPSGKAIGSIGADGTTTCVATDDGDWFLYSGSNLVATNNKVSIGSLGYRGAKLLVASDSAINQPQLEAYETQQDYARINLTTYGSAATPHANFWSIAAQTFPDGDGPAMDRLNLFNSRVGDLFSLLGNGWASIGGSTPHAPLTVYSDGQYGPGIGNGRGDLYVGNGDAGLSLGVAMGGGGYGASRIWSKGGVDQLLIGTTTDGDMVSIINGEVGIANNNPGNTLDVAGDVRIRGLSGAPDGLRQVMVDANGDLSARASESHSMMVPNVAFRPGSSTEGWNAFGASYFQTGGSTSPGFAAVSGIPQGAKVTGLTAWVTDNTSIRNLRVCLESVSVHEAALDWSSCIETTGASGATWFWPIGGTLATQPVVDNLEHSLQVTLYPIDSTTFDYSTWVSNLAVRAVRIDYVEL